jgi:hypothetical protein
MVAPSLQSRLQDLPGWEIVSAGLNDIAAGHRTPAACAVWIAVPRLRKAGLINDTDLARRVTDPELTLYRLLRAEPGDAYARYNATLRRLVSFEHALDRLVRTHAV